MNDKYKSVILTGSQPVLMDMANEALKEFVPVKILPFSHFAFDPNNAAEVMAYVMGDLSSKHVYNLELLKQGGCRFLAVFAEHLTVPAMCELIRVHVDDVFLTPIGIPECERLQDKVLPILGCDTARKPGGLPRITNTLSPQNAINFEEIIQLIEEHFCAKLSLSRVANELNLSPSRVSHLFKDVCSLGFRQYLTYRRLEEAETLLALPRASITSIAFGLGFSSPSHFCRAFKETFGLTPKAYLSGNRQLVVDSNFKRYQHLRVTLLPQAHPSTQPGLPPARAQFHNVI